MDLKDILTDEDEDEPGPLNRAHGSVQHPPRGKRLSFFQQKNLTNFGNRRIFTESVSPHQSPHHDTKARQRGEPTIRHRVDVLQEVPVPEVNRGVYSLRYSPNGHILVVGYGGGGIQIRNPKTGKLEKTIRNSAATGLPLMSLRFNPTRPEIFYGGSACGGVFSCNTESGEYFRCILEKSEVNALDFNMSGLFMATGNKDSGVRLYDVPTSKCVTRYRRPSVELEESTKRDCHTMRVFAVRFHPQNPNVMVSGGWDDTVRIWDVRVKDGCTSVIRGPHITGDAIDMQDNTILTGSWVVTGALQLWDLRTGGLIETVVPYNRAQSLNGEFLYAATFLNGDIYNDMVVVGGSGLENVEIISIKEKAIVGKFQVHKTVLAIDTLLNALAFGGEETVLRIGQIS